MVSGQQRGKEARGGGVKQVWSVGREEDKVAWKSACVHVFRNEGGHSGLEIILVKLGEKDSEIDEES